NTRRDKLFAFAASGFERSEHPSQNEKNSQPPVTARTPYYKRDGWEPEIRRFSLFNCASVTKLRKNSLFSNFQKNARVSPSCQAPTKNLITAQNPHCRICTQS